MRHLKFVMAAFFLALTSPALAQTTLPLNTGYNHGTFSPYATPSGAVSSIQDNYWIKIASYEPPAASTTVAPAWVLNPSFAPWAPPISFPNSRWIGPRNTPASPTGVSAINPGYSIFRKCFCLMAGYKNPALSFQMRGDDNINVWLNATTTTLLAPIIGNWGGGPVRSGGTNDVSRFRVGRNCIYVLVEDFGGHIGFNLAGSVSATGLMPTAGAGTGVSFEPCACSQGGHGPGPGPVSASAAAVRGGPAARMAAPVAQDDNDEAVVQELVKFAEARRIARIRAGK